MIASNVDKLNFIQDTNKSTWKFYGAVKQSTETLFNNVVSNYILSKESFRTIAYRSFTSALFYLQKNISFYSLEHISLLS